MLKLGQRAVFFIRILSLGFDREYGSKQYETIAKIPAEELNALARKWLSPEATHIIVLGDKTMLENELSDLNQKIVIIDLPE